jgi:hypothetical protein
MTVLLPVFSCLTVKTTPATELLGMVDASMGCLSCSLTAKITVVAQVAVNRFEIVNRK